MCVLSTLRNSVTQIIGSRVTWHPPGITAVRRFTIEPCAALPKRRLKGIPSFPIKKANPDEACPFTIIPEPCDNLVDTVQEGNKSEGKKPEEYNDLKLIATLEPPSEVDPQALKSYTEGPCDERPYSEEEFVDINPDYFHCHTSTLAYIKYISDKQLEEATNLNDFYDKSELPLSFIEEEENLYD